MLLRAFTVYDVKVEAFLRPFFMQTPAEAIRAFTETVNDGQSAFFKHPEDFTLYEVGTYDESSGKLSAIDHVHLGLAINFKQE